VPGGNRSAGLDLLGAFRAEDQHAKRTSKVATRSPPVDPASWDEIRTIQF